MSEPTSTQLLPKPRWLLMSIAFLLGCIASVCVVWTAMGYNGHGHDPSPWMLLGPGGLSPFLFPLVCVAAASRWLPGIGAALTWEMMHHAMAAKYLLDASGDSLGASFLQNALAYLFFHLPVTAILIFKCLRWLEARRAQKLKLPSTHTFKPKEPHG
jgi:hypothetical protein